ncbi:MAG: methylmalonyl Co-A mutase-associated GTPase MeaB [Saprospiraceae bacterium]|nr:methylmalonyl Co-A mutase-associated GTPase MeaB [Saprospiraceae bacterium]
MPRNPLSVDAYVNGILAGDRIVLGRAITLVESSKPEHQAVAREVIGRLLERPDKPADSYRIAITGSPGVGKSTFIEALGTYLVDQGERVAVLAIDPSSAVSGGSILGDKTRMEQLSVSERAFIRPSPSGDSLGGVARKTRETILLVEAAGYTTVLLETVGVGQSEVAAHSMTDLFLLLLLPGAGDELQGIKRGIVEMADLLVVNKADNDRIALAKQAQAWYRNAIHLFPAQSSGWTPRVLTCSAQEKNGIDEVWVAAKAYRKLLTDNGGWTENRRRQAQYWLREALHEGLLRTFYNHPAVRQRLAALEPAVLEGRMSPFAAAEETLRNWTIDSIDSIGSIGSIER